MPGNPFDQFDTQMGPLPSPPEKADKPPKPDLPTGWQMSSAGVAQPIPGLPATAVSGLQPDVPAPGDTSKSGDDYLKTIEPGLAGQVKALSEGRRAFPTGTALKDPKVQELIAAATQYDPNLDATNAATRVSDAQGFHQRRHLAQYHRDQHGVRPFGHACPRPRRGLRTAPFRCGTRSPILPSPLSATRA
jgi:hypothetical protein